MIAIIPAGGQGTRMRAVTGGSAKEALPLGNRTVLDLVLDEAFAAGVERAVVVSSPQKPEIEAILAARNDWVDMRLQREPKGLAHAIACAGQVEDDALILLPDTVFRQSDWHSAELGKMLQMADGAILGEIVSDTQMGSYGIMEIENKLITKILEKPSPAETASRIAVSGRYALSDRVLRMNYSAIFENPRLPGMDHLEVDFSGVLSRAILAGMRLQGLVLPTGAKRFDCGSPEGYALACEALGP